MSLPTKTIEKSKNKILLTVFGGLIFVAIGVWMVTAEPGAISGRRSPAMIKFFGFASILFFGGCSVIGCIGFFKKAPPLTLSAQGYSVSGLSKNNTAIEWSEISELKIYQVQRTKMIIPVLKDPQRYIEGLSGVKKKLAQSNLSMVGSPLSISSVTYDTSFDELLEDFTRYFEASL